MATRRTQPATIDQLPATGSDPATATTVAALFPDEETPNDVALLSVLEQIGESDTECSVNVYRIIGEGGKNVESYLQKFSPTEFSRDGLDELRRLYGGGDYRIRVYGPLGKLIANKRISIEAPKGFKPGMMQEAEQSGGMRELAQAMQAGFAAMTNTLATALQSMQRPQESRSDFLKEMAMMRQIFAPENSAPRQNDGQLIDMFLKGIAVAREAIPKAGEASETDLLLEGIRTFGPPIAEAMKAQNAKQPATALQTTAPPVPAIPAQAFPVAIIPNEKSVTESQPATIQQGADMKFMVQQALSFLIQQAKADNNPETYAELVLDHVSEEEIRALLEGDDWLDRVANLNPEVKQYAAWFGELKISILAYLTQAPEGDIPSP